MIPFVNGYFVRMLGKGPFSFDISNSNCTRNLLRNILIISEGKAISQPCDISSMLWEKCLEIRIILVPRERRQINILRLIARVDILEGNVALFLNNYVIMIISCVEFWRYLSFRIFLPGGAWRKIAFCGFLQTCGDASAARDHFNVYRFRVLL